MPCCTVVVALALAVTTAAANDLRDRRWIRAEPPWWRKALKTPEMAVEVLAWPLKEAVIWTEKVNLPRRVRDALYFNEERTAGWFPNFDLGGEIGPAAGLKLFHENLWGNEEQILLSTLFGFDSMTRPAFEEEQLHFRFFVPPESSPFHFRAELFQGDDRDEDFFVRRNPDGSLATGGKTREADLTTYGIHQARGRLEVGGLLTDDLGLALAFRPLFADVDPGAGREPPIPREIDGVGGPTVLLGGGPVIRWDRRDSSVRPRRGTFVRAEGGLWRSVEGATLDRREFEYYRYNIEVEQHLPTFRPDRTLAVRAFLDRVDPRNDGAIPFWDLSILDEDRLLRGFDRNRFRDRGSLVVNVEYRYPIWDLWDGFLFLDEGQVFPEFSDVDLDRFEWSAGGGVRFYTADSFLFRIRYAISDEGQRFKIGLSQEF